MHPRATELIQSLSLQPHPEGGHFREIFRSPLSVTPPDGRGQRSALTLIHFLLTGGAVSRWHRVRSDEAWHHCEGAPLELFTVPPGGGEISRAVLGPLTAAEGDSAPVHVVRAGWWQGARPLGDYALVSCSVGPGFDFADFTMLSSLPVAERPAMSPESLLAELL